MGYYDGTKLLSLKDINGNIPEIFIVTTNRTGGKTTYFNRLLMNRFIKNNMKFMLLYRFKTELSNISDKFFKDIRNLYFPHYTMSEKKKEKGAYIELYITKDDSPNEKINCGYAVALNSADTVKRLSHLFSDVGEMLMDEFQSETGHYCNDEVNKFKSIHTSVARGKGEQTRYVPVFMLSNPVTLLNPYYAEMGISARLNTETKFLKGDGYVLEQGFVESASEAQLNSGFFRAFNGANDKYNVYSAQGIYLRDSCNFIETPKGKNRYLLTLKYKGAEYGVRAYDDLGIIYCDNKPDTTYKSKIAVTTEDHAINYVMLKSNCDYLYRLKYYFEQGCFRFKDLKCKECIMTALSY